MVVETRSPDVASSSLPPKKPWWNRPLIGDKSLLDRIKALLSRENVVPEAIEFHEVTFKKLQNLSERMSGIDNDKFGNKEFLAFVRISGKLHKNEGSYANLLKPTILLRSGLTAHQSFTKLEQIEFAHRGRKFNEFYTFVNDLCIQRVDSEKFCHKTKTKSAEMFPIFKSLEGREALRQYTFHLGKIGQQQSSLNLLYAFKRLQFHNYTIFQHVADVLKSLKRSDLMKMDVITTQIIQNYESFEKLGSLIGLRPEQQNLQTYACLFQFLAMSERHARAYEQFRSLASQFELWQELAQKLNHLRAQHPITEYRVPKQFLATLPGARIYHKYAQYFGE